CSNSVSESASGRSPRSRRAISASSSASECSKSGASADVVSLLFPLMARKSKPRARIAPMTYSASDIEVLSGLDPVRRRPGMYTETSRPNHLAHEVVDNSVDEALAGHCDTIEVTVFKDG